jgi:hypothetical protein
MDEPLTLWAKLFLRLGLVLLAVGVLPLLATQIFAFDPLIPLLLSLSVAPLGAVVLVVAIILFLAALGRRRQGPS